MNILPVILPLISATV
ncbi:uncharacterized protein J3R85_002186, partial [Psidium guajava]